MESEIIIMFMTEPCVYLPNGERNPIKAAAIYVHHINIILDVQITEGVWKTRKWANEN